MAQQIMIIGMGRFGMSLARTLSERGAEVLAVDSRRALIDEAADFAAEAVAVDATDEVELARLHPEQRDAVVCAIGGESKEASIICTALLRQMGAKLVIARAADRTHQRILKLVGAHQIVNPEQEFGSRFANRLLYRGLIADSVFGSDLQLTEIAVQPSMVGRSLVELALPKRFGVLVAAIRRGEGGKLSQPSPTEQLKEGDNLVIVSSETALTNLMKGV